MGTTTTGPFGFYKPDDGESPWGQSYRDNFDLLDGGLSGIYPAVKAGVVLGSGSDQSVALQAAYDNAAAANMALGLPPGIYYHATKLNWQTSRTKVIGGYLGMGQALLDSGTYNKGTVLQFTGSTGPGIDMIAGATKRGIVIEGVTFIGDCTGWLVEGENGGGRFRLQDVTVYQRSTSGSGISMADWNNAEVKNLTVTGRGDAALMVEGARFWSKNAVGGVITFDQLHIERAQLALRLGNDGGLEFQVAILHNTELQNCDDGLRIDTGCRAVHFLGFRTETAAQRAAIIAGDVRVCTIDDLFMTNSAAVCDVQIGDSTLSGNRRRARYVAIRGALFGQNGGTTPINILREFASSSDVGLTVERAGFANASATAHIALGTQGGIGTRLITIDPATIITGADPERIEYTDGQVVEGIRRTIPVNATTTNATTATAASFTLADATLYTVLVTITAVKSDGTQRASYRKRALVYRTGGGAATLQGSVETIGTDVESDANWNATIDVSSNDVRVRVTGVASTTVRWRGVLEIHKSTEAA